MNIDSGLAGSCHAEELLAQLKTSPAEGLTPAEAARRLEELGPNRLPARPREPVWRRFAAQFTDPLVLTLLAAAVVAVVVGLSGGEAAGQSWLSRFADAIAILLIVLLNAVIGFYQEARAEQALEALEKLAAPVAKVRRDGKLMEIESAFVVPGDILELEAGDAVAADARLLHTMDLATEESALTGESVPRGKDAMAHIGPDTALADRDTMVFTGTTVIRGRGRAVVTATGSASELGRIGSMIASIDDQKTPLEVRLDAFGRIILRVCLGLSAALLLWGFVRPAILGGTTRLWHTLLLEAVALAVAAIPEGLPAITTITLALGMQRMARRGAIVRKLPAVETLGAATVICSDKTGTLTKNEMTVRRVYAAEQHFSVGGTGYSPAGDILDREGHSVVSGEMPETLRQLLATAALCNNAELHRDDERGWYVIGDPTEGALLTLAEKANLPPASVHSQHQLVGELPFDSDRKRMTVIARDATGRVVAYVKGGVDGLLPRCNSIETDNGQRPILADDRAAILEAAESMSKQALRVLALCHRHLVDEDGDGSADRVEVELTFLGLVGMMDPPRDGVREAVATCRRAGISPVMITGDHKVTARAIAEEIGMWFEGDEAVTGAELAAMDDATLGGHISRIRVFARTTPEQKLRIVRAIKAKGHVVAMTGDGVNDAPALRESSIGVAMGRAGTDVARQAADLVLADDNFATIVDAVREGRAIYRNIQKFIFFLLSANMGLVVAVFAVSFFGDWPPLTPLMVLWINLVTNGAPALALGVDPPERRLMEEPPRPPDESLMVFRDYVGILYVGVVMGLAAVAIYALAPQSDLLEARALAFSLLALSPLMHAFSCRSPVRSVFSSKPLLSIPLLAAVIVSASIHLVAVLVPALQPVFKTFPVAGAQWVMVLGLAVLVVPAVELAKRVNRGHLTVATHRQKG